MLKSEKTINIVVWHTLLPLDNVFFFLRLTRWWHQADMQATTVDRSDTLNDAVVKMRQTG